MSIFDYISKYGDYSFLDKGFNEVDNVILSVLSYVDFDGIIINKDKLSIKEAGETYFKIHYKKEKNITGVRNAIDIFKRIYNKKRYSNLLLYNYVYIGDDSQQFSALSIDIDDNTTYISFEGTDQLISGWEEDFKMSYMFPVEAQKQAVRYVNRYFTFSRKKIIIGGHSKGGNLAMVAGMCCNFIVRNKIINIYSNDGPGLRKRELESYKYNRIKHKFIHIIPNYSIVGLLLRHEDNNRVIYSNKKSIYAHSVISWEVNDNRFKDGDLSDMSRILDNSMIMWLDKYNFEDREVFVKSLFDIFRECNIDNLIQIMNNNKLIIDIIKKSNTLTNDNKRMILDFLSVFLNCFKDYEIEKIKNKFN